MKAIASCAVLAALAAAPGGQAPARPLPNRSCCRSVAAAKPWGRDLRQIPSTVIDKGVLRHVPYTSYRAGDYELNVYGDPAGFEIGLHQEAPKGEAAERICFEFVSELLDDAADRALLKTLKGDADRKIRAGLTFEVPPRGRGRLRRLVDLRLRRGRPRPLARHAGGASEDHPDARGLQARRGREKGGGSPDDTGYILFICANSDKHEDREVLLKVCPACGTEDTFFWDTDRKCFVAFACGAPYDNAKIKCPDCGRVPRRVRTKHK